MIDSRKMLFAVVIILLIRLKSK